MAIPEDDDIRDRVASWILNSAADRDCLYELTYNWEDLTEEEDRIVTDKVYEIFGRAKVYVVIDEVEYNGN
ncbi:MAG TPA: hypothetical protein VFT53_07510 [Candidatus Saccharimonadales bacterium]|nr:hypothetical protein [Candidatus Saccharimonadales bacterium]